MDKINITMLEPVYVVVVDHPGTSMSTNLCVCSTRGKAEYVVELEKTFPEKTPREFRIEEYVVDLMIKE